MVSLTENVYSENEIFSSANSFIFVISSICQYILNKTGAKTNWLKIILCPQRSIDSKCSLIIRLGKCLS